ncbi:MAG: response regulator transcription factor [Solirubrobacteraceae bacterium]
MRQGLQLIHGAGAAGSSGSRPISVVIVEDHKTMRRGLRMLLAQEQDIEVVAEAGDLATALQDVRRLHPRVLVLDLLLPDGSGLDAIAPLRVGEPDTQIVCLTMQDSPAFAKRALDAGAVGFVLKDTAEVELGDAVRDAARGERYTSSRMATILAALER